MIVRHIFDDNYWMLTGYFIEEHLKHYINLIKNTGNIIIFTQIRKLPKIEKLDTRINP